MCESVPQLRYHNPHLRVVVRTPVAEDAPLSIKFKTGGPAHFGPHLCGCASLEVTVRLPPRYLCTGDSWRQADVDGLSGQEIKELVSKFDWTTSNT